MLHERNVSLILNKVKVKVKGKVHVLYSAMIHDMTRAVNSYMITRTNSFCGAISNSGLRLRFMLFTVELCFSKAMSPYPV